MSIVLISTDVPRTRTDEPGLTTDRFNHLFSSQTSRFALYEEVSPPPEPESHTTVLNPKRNNRSKVQSFSSGSLLSYSPSRSIRSSEHDQKNRYDVRHRSPRSSSAVRDGSEERCMYRRRKESKSPEFQCRPRETKHESPIATYRFPEERHWSPEARRRSPEVSRRSPEVRRRSPEARRRSPEVSCRFPEVRRHSPEVRHHSPEARRRSPEVRRRSPEVSCRFPEVRWHSPEVRWHSLELRRHSPEFCHRSPEVRRHSPEDRRRSQEFTRRSPEVRHRSPEARRHSPEFTRRSPDDRGGSPEARRRSPEVRRRSPEVRRHSPEFRHRSPDVRRRSPEVRRRSPEFRRCSRSPIRQRRRSPSFQRYRCPSPQFRSGRHLPDLGSLSVSSYSDSRNTSSIFRFTDHYPSSTYRQSGRSSERREHRTPSLSDISDATSRSSSLASYDACEIEDQAFRQKQDLAQQTSGERRHALAASSSEHISFQRNSHASIKNVEQSTICHSSTAPKFQTASAVNSKTSGEQQHALLSSEYKSFISSLLKAIQPTTVTVTPQPSTSRKQPQPSPTTKHEVKSSVAGYDPTNPSLSSVKPHKVSYNPFCPLCCDQLRGIQKLPAANMCQLKEHVFSFHLPWYIAVTKYELLNKDGTDFRRSLLADQLHPVLFHSVDTLTMLPSFFTFLWGKLLQSFVLQLCKKLHLNGPYQLRTHVIDKEYYPDSNVISDLSLKLTDDEKILMNAHQAYINDGMRVLEASPPNCLSAVLHWITVVNVVCRLPKQEQTEFAVFCAYTEKDIYIVDPGSFHPKSYTSNILIKFWNGLGKGLISEILEIVARYPDILQESHHTGVGPIQFALSKKSYSATRALLFYGANVDEKDEKGWTPLCRSAYAGNIEAVKILLAWGASEQKEKALAIARGEGHINVCEMIAGVHSKNSPIESYSATKHKEEVVSLPSTKKKENMKERKSKFKVTSHSLEQYPDMEIWQCEFCGSKFMGDTDQKSHFVTKHLPWYLSVNHTRASDSSLYKVLRPALQSYIKKKQVPFEFFARLWGKLLHSFLHTLSTYLKLDHSSQLVRYVVQKKLMSSQGVEPTFVEKIMMKSHQLYIGEEDKELVLSPPNCLSSILHWKCLMDIFNKLSSNDTEDLGDLEMFETINYLKKDVYPRGFNRSMQLSTTVMERQFWSSLEEGNLALLWQVILQNEELVHLQGTTDTHPCPLQCAISCGHPNAARLLLFYGAPTDRKDIMGFIPLWGAAFKGNADGVNLLLPWVMTEEKKGAISMARVEGHKQIVKALKKSIWKDGFTSSNKNFEHRNELVKKRSLEDGNECQLQVKKKLSVDMTKTQSASTWHQGVTKTPPVLASEVTSQVLAFPAIAPPAPVRLHAPPAMYSYTVAPMQSMGPSYGMRPCPPYISSTPSMYTVIPQGISACPISIPQMVVSPASTPASPTKSSPVKTQPSRKNLVSLTGNDQTRHTGSGSTPASVSGVTIDALIAKANATSLKFKPLTESNYSNAQCPLCGEIRHGQLDIKYHVTLTHLPWYFALKFNKDSRISQSKLAKQFLPVVGTCFEAKCKVLPFGLFLRLLGKLLHGFLEMIRNFLGLKKTNDLVTYVSRLNLYPDKSIEFWNDDKLLIRAHRDFIGDNTAAISISPPNCLSAVLHWTTIVNIMNKLPPPTWNTIQTFEKYTARNIIDKKLGSSAKPVTASDLILLQKAILDHNLQLIWQLLDQCPQIAVTHLDSLNGITPVEYAVGLGKFQEATMLFFYGAMADQPNRSGWAPIRTEAERGNFSSVNFLITWNASSQIQEAYDAAAKFDHTCICQLLRSQFPNVIKDHAKHIKPLIGVLANSTTPAEQSNPNRVALVHLPAKKESNLSKDVPTSPDDSSGKKNERMQCPDATGQIANTLAESGVPIDQSEDCDVMEKSIPDRDLGSHVNTKPEEAYDAPVSCSHAPVTELSSCRTKLRTDHAVKLHVTENNQEIEKANWRCPICHMFTSSGRQHALQHHLPWYISPGIEFQHLIDGPRKTKLAAKVASSMIASLVKPGMQSDDIQISCFVKLLGQLQLGLLVYIAKHLGSSDPSELLIYTKSNRLWPGPQAKLLPIDEFSMRAFQTYTKDEECNIQIGPPNHISALLHWNTLVNLIVNLPPAYQDDALTFEQFDVPKTECIVRTVDTEKGQELKMSLPSTLSVPTTTKEEFISAMASSNLALLCDILDTWPMLVYYPIPTMEHASAILFSLANKQYQVPAVLYLYGASPDQMDASGSSPLHRVAKMGHVKSVEILLSLEVNIEMKNTQGKTALDIAKEGNFHDIVSLLEEQVCENTSDNTEVVCVVDLEVIPQTLEEKTTESSKVPRIRIPLSKRVATAPLTSVSSSPVEGMSGTSTSQSVLASPVENTISDNIAARTVSSQPVAETSCASTHIMVIDKPICQQPLKRCGVCADLISGNHRVHAAKHLPWFACVLGAHPKPTQRTRLSVMILPIIAHNILVKGVAPATCFTKVWGELLSTFLNHICHLLGLSSIAALVRHMSANNLWPNANTFISSADRFTAMALQKFLNLASSDLTLNPPHEISSLMHWESLLNLISSLPKHHHDEMFLFENYTIKQPVSKFASVTGKKEVVMEIVSPVLKISPNVKTDFKSWVKSGNIDKTCELLDKHPDLVYLPFPGSEHSGIIRVALDGKNLHMAVAARLYGADPDHRDHLGRTPLHRFAARNDVKSIRCLLVLGASPHLTTVDGKTTPATLAWKKKAMQSYKLLKEEEQRSKQSEETQLSPSAVIRKNLKSLPVTDQVVVDKEAPVVTPLQSTCRESEQDEALDATQLDDDDRRLVIDEAPSSPRIDPLADDAQHKDETTQLSSKEANSPEALVCGYIPDSASTEIMVKSVSGLDDPHMDVGQNICGSQSDDIVCDDVIVGNKVDDSADGQTKDLMEVSKDGVNIGVSGMDESHVADQGECPSQPDDSKDLANCQSVESRGSMDLTLVKDTYNAADTKLNVLPDGDKGVEGACQD